MNMGMVEQVLSPRMQHTEKTNLRTQVVGIGGNLKHRVSADAKKQLIKKPLFCKPIAANSCGTVKTTWKYGTGSTSEARAASH